jgi:hypothetical protein
MTLTRCGTGDTFLGDAMNRKYYNRMISLKYRFKEWFFENITPKLPKIPTRKPKYPGVPICLFCHHPPIIHAYHTGDGWLFFWDCEGRHISDRRPEEYITDWFPFLFGWATAKDLERIGIEVV